MKSNLFLLPMAALLASAAHAQTVNVDSASLLQRLDRIETRLSNAENRGGGLAASRTGSSPAGSALADMEERMGLLEQQGGQVNGGVERLSHAVEQLAKQVDLMNKDFDQRLTAIEQKSSHTAPAATPVQPAQPVADASATQPAAKAPVATTSATAPATPEVAEVPAGLTATEHYNKAYAYLTAADYPNALKWLTAFTDRFPTDKLADNAWYWLGEVNLVQNRPEQALVAFKEGLQKFPKGAKAPANLYKMGLALQQLKQFGFARSSWEKLTRDYPNAPETAKAKAKIAELPKEEPAEKPADKPAAKPAAKAATPAKPAAKK